MAPAAPLYYPPQQPATGAGLAGSNRTFLLVAAIACFCAALPFIFELVAISESMGGGRRRATLTFFTMQGLFGLLAFATFAVALFGMKRGIAVAVGVVAVLYGIAQLMLFIAAVAKSRSFFEIVFAYILPISGFCLWIMVGVLGFASQRHWGGRSVAVGVVGILAGVLTLVPFVIAWGGGSGRSSGTSLFVVFLAALGFRLITMVVLGVAFLQERSRGSAAPPGH